MDSNMVDVGNSTMDYNTSSTASFIDNGIPKLRSTISIEQLSLNMVNCVFGFIAFMGNLWVIHLFYRFKSLRKVDCVLLIVSMAVSDTIMGLGCMITGVDRIRLQFSTAPVFNKLYCIGIAVPMLIGMFSSQLHACSIAIDRLIAVLDPFKYKTMNHYKLHRQAKITRVLAKIVLLYVVLWVTPNIFYNGATVIGVSRAVLGRLGPYVACGSVLNAASNIIVYSLKHPEIRKYSIIAMNSFKNGSQTVSQKLVELITTKLNNKAEIKLSMAVLAAETMGDTVTLSLMQTGGPTKFQVDQVRCKRVIFAIPPNQLSPINFQPPLPYYRQKLAQGAPMGNLVKFVITYETPFWREMGLSGEIAASGLTHKRGEVRPILTTFDGTTEKGSPALVGFLHNEWAGVESTIRKEAVLEDLAKYFGANALTYIDYIDKSWSDEPYSGGCPVAVLPPGMMQYFVHIRNIDGLYHYAATETATSWLGYMDGAVQSGKRAAKEVLLKLNVDNLLPSDMEMGCTLHSDYCPPIEQNRYYPRKKYYYWKSIISVVLLGAIIGIVACKIRDNLV